MISWLKGQIIQNWQQSSKKGIVLNVGGIGYEIQLLAKQLDIIDNSITNEFWIHQINRDDCTNLYGFNELNQRDLFRKIIGINGIGPQIAMALLEEFDVKQLVFAIEDNDIRLLTKSQGIGKRIAERLIVELRNKLHKFKDSNEIPIDIKENKTTNMLGKYLEEIESILNSLGYLDNEIKESIQFIITKEKETDFLLNSLSPEEKTVMLDKHLKEILIRLSEKST
tara:strand:+ start:1072 stop:1746 length:675 start_codon:yes stop_codon:yes gene_type:complete